MNQKNKSICLLVASILTASSFAAVAGDVSHKRLLNADKEVGNWLTHHKNFEAHRFSKLEEVNTKNVKNLSLAWTFQLGGIQAGGIWPHGGLEGTPIVEDGIMYVTDGWGSVYAISVGDDKGKLLWKMDPETDKDWGGAVACCGVNNRGVALWKDKIVSHTLDGRLIVANKATGKIEWEKEVADPSVGETLTAAPLVVKDMVITGVAGAEYGIRGWIAATDLSTQKELWRTYTIPKPGEKGSETWKDDYDAWKNGGGSTWVTGSYDAETNMILWGVGNPGPDWDNEFRPGDNLYTNSVVALDADTGAIDWHFQYTPNDPFDYDGVNENVLVDTKIDGKKRKVMLHANRNGFAYAIDRATGEFLWGKPFVDRLTWTPGLDSKGKPVAYKPNQDVQHYAGQTAASRTNKEGVSCPGNMGGKNWPPTTYNPEAQLWYIPVIESCNTQINEETKPGTWQAREWWTGGGLKQHEQITGSVAAVDPKTGKVVAKHHTQYPQLGGLVSTAGNLVFVGNPDGRLSALDGKSLEELWSFETGAGLNAPPITFSANGKQYVAIMAGLGGAWPKWFVDGTKGLEKIEPSSTLYVFSL
ncbi:PQQ-dependent dehydrogenase, methanol/ethanol family [Neptuniibacter pectenicola]|uniref:PQQ-dependent dehydrogenase, methanol/ethanol family n=1 Tax=Neptuniibacter pectenicola TaxID=1806669 RepID=A0ABU9TNF4_9GAMM